jgi:hypothetical protein
MNPKMLISIDIIVIAAVVANTVKDIVTAKAEDKLTEMKLSKVKITSKVAGNAAKVNTPCINTKVIDVTKVKAPSDIKSSYSKMG